MIGKVLKALFFQNDAVIFNEFFFIIILRKVRTYGILRMAYVVTLSLDCCTSLQYLFTTAFLEYSLLHMSQCTKSRLTTAVIN